MGERTSAPTARTAASGWLQAAIGPLLQSPMLYDLVQLLAGEHQFRKRLAPHLRALPPDGSLIDIGGGTGLGRERSAAQSYVCVDLDFQKLRRFQGGRAGRLAVVADAAACPFDAATFDGILCAKVLHHLNDAALTAVLAETARILKPGGVLILADAIRSSRWMSRVLWRLDRGSFPRSAAQIRTAVPAEYVVTGWEEFRVAIFHEFVLYAARKEAGTDAK